VALLRTDVSEEPGASFIRVTKIGELGTTQAATSNRRTLRSFVFSLERGKWCEIRSSALDKNIDINDLLDSKYPPLYGKQ
jgi:hypothetical protein